MRTPNVPKGARRIRTYAEFQSYLEDFANRREPFVWVVGRPGLSKSQSIKAATAGKKVRYHKAGQLTPAAFFIDCYNHLGEPIILDDAEHLLDSKLGFKLVCALTETDKAKQMDYGTTSKLIRDAGVPQKYYTNSQLCVIANRVTAHEAVMSRASALLHFDPTNLEVHQSVAGWFWDQEIFDWMGRHLQRLLPVDVRWYVHAAKDKKNRRDWRRIILDAYSLDKASALVQELEGDPEYQTVEEKVAEFTGRMSRSKGASRRTYFRVKKRLEEAGQLTALVVPALDLGKNKPPEDFTTWELDQMTERINQPVEREEEEVHSVDIPAPSPREVFTGATEQPAPAQAPERQRPATPRNTYETDDTLPWETPDDDT